MKRKAIFIVSVLLLSYYLTFLIFGKSTFVDEIASENNSTYEHFKWTEKISVVSNVEFDKIEHIGQQIAGDSLQINYLIINAKKFPSEVFEKDFYNYILLFDSYSPWIDLTEGEKIEEYGAFWNRQYVWAFFCWIQIKETSLGIS